MSEEALAIVQQFNDRFGETGEIPLDLVDPDVVVIDHDIPDAGDYHGFSGIQKWLVEDWGSAWENYTVDEAELVDAGDTVLSVFTLVARGRGSGVETRRRNATVNTVENGLIKRIEYFTTEDEARSAAGLAAPRKA